MPNKPQGQSHPGQQHNGGGVSAQAQDFGQKIQERAGQVGDRVREGFDSAREAVSDNYRQAGEVVSRNPGSSVLVGFGLGFGLGVLLTVLFTKTEEESWYDRYMPDGLRNVPDRFKNFHVPRIDCPTHAGT